ncbi:MAG: 50S ribosomal protein L33 [bacterium]|nr:50S ribosomal protein L33 [bacterium]
MSQKNLIGLRCDSCGRAGYISRTNPKKMVARKIEASKFCKWCRKHTKHKEAKLPIKAAPKKQAPKTKKVAGATDKPVKAPKAPKVAKTKEAK